ncbi:nitrogenase FeMo-cofactor synthesis FeS core scaffold and assembly protein NifB [Desulfocucumis palustris]|uniref:FeMo cofactor biosynthesis protein NifB n=1 Tax=Desulfocucumis palustris TaxID=1898651 RepID=A0A2L2X9X5_9FIRM|nr:nitrogenase cofactor biosynthesis protein NifB [Desulfocucumis palustris]GBF33077.1 nitrogenase FeMo-cofactor synthesis FeS core scaffold and assembly protein NifB [Desulfocucumis palustris]
MDCQCARKQGHDLNNDAVSADLLRQTDRHPCYSFDAHHKYARMHVPVAPKCNISCNYCNRKFDCVNESRPGVTSEILTPERALQKFNLVREKLSALSVVGIAGPGDALANWAETRRTIELVKQSAPDIIFCLSTNGLLLPEYAGEIAELGVKHVTVTVNSLDPEIGRNIYKYVNYKGKRYQGKEAAARLMANQLAGIELLVRSGMLVKVNIVMIKNINDTHIPDIVKKVKELGAFITNIMPLIPAPGSAFADFPGTDTQELNHMRNICQADLRQMYHCRQCRADAIGLLGDDRSFEFRLPAEDNDISPAEAVKEAV